MYHVQFDENVVMAKVNYVVRLVKERCIAIGLGVSESNRGLYVETSEYADWGALGADQSQSPGHGESYGIAFSGGIAINDINQVLDRVHSACEEQGLYLRTSTLNTGGRIGVDPAKDLDLFEMPDRSSNAIPESQQSVLAPKLCSG